MSSRPAERRTTDLGIVMRAAGMGVEVVVGVVEAGLLGASGLGGIEHAERGGGLEPERLDAFDHGADLIEIALLRRAPSRAHAEPARARALRGPRLGDDRVE